MTDVFNPIKNIKGSLTFAVLIKTLVVGILCGLLIVGLWPFHSPQNRVEWLGNTNGLQFSGHSSIVSAATFQIGAGQENDAESIEVWLAPSSLRSTNTILSFDALEHPGCEFQLRQYKEALIVRHCYIDGFQVARTEWLAVSRAVREQTPVLVTVALGKRATSIYIDGVLREVFATRGDSTNNLVGRLLVGNSPQTNDSWSGQILGLALYRSELTPTQVAGHHDDWGKGGQPILGANEMPIALYVFDERQGIIVRNHLDEATSLLIPKRYFVLHPLFLASIKHDYQATWTYWENVGVNVGGFVPLGFIGAIYFSEVLSTKRLLAPTLCLGLLVSLTIETLQVFLPTRSSGSTDLLTNTLGTGIGVVILHTGLGQNLLSKVRQQFAVSSSVNGISPKVRQAFHDQHSALRRANFDVSVIFTQTKLTGISRVAKQ